MAHRPIQFLYYHMYTGYVVKNIHQITYIYTITFKVIQFTHLYPVNITVQYVRKFLHTIIMSSFHSVLFQFTTRKAYEKLGVGLMHSIFRHHFCSGQFRANIYAVTLEMHRGTHVGLHVRRLQLSPDFNKHWNASENLSKISRIFRIAMLQSHATISVKILSLIYTNYMLSYDPPSSGHTPILVSQTILSAMYRSHY
jgi:hypothetical protein